MNNEITINNAKHVKQKNNSYKEKLQQLFFIRV